MIGAIISEVQITHEEVDISDCIRLDHITFIKQAYFFENTLCHLQAFFYIILSRFKMAVDETEQGVVQCELDHDTSFPAIADHILHDVVLAGVAHEATVIIFDEDDKEYLALAYEVYLDVLIT